MPGKTSSLAKGKAPKARLEVRQARIADVSGINALVGRAYDDLPAYTTYDLSVGVAKDRWTAQIYGTNITDTRGF